LQVQTVNEYEILNKTCLESFKVMIVDDESMICETLEMFFESIGIKDILSVYSGEKAIEEIDNNSFDYIFVDLMMPGIGGMETLKRLHEKNQLTNVIIMTGYPSMDIAIDAIRNGASDFLVKPFRFQDVKIILERIHRFRILMEKNWVLHQELEKKKEIELLNRELEKKIKTQTLMFDIADSLSRINKSEDLYRFLVNKGMNACNAQKGCFVMYENGDFSNLLVLSQDGLENREPGTMMRIKGKRDNGNGDNSSLFEACFGKTSEKNKISKNGIVDNHYLAIPFNIRNEPFGILLVGEKSNKREFNSEDEYILKFLAERTALNIENIALYDNLMQSLMASFMSLVSAIEAKDPYTQQHSSRVTNYSLKLAHIMECSEDDIQRLKSCAPLHDIGKIGIHDSILNKSTSLSNDEFEEIKAHPLIGVNIVSPLGLDPSELAIIRNHHERWDGKGYPDGLKGEEIPFLSRILGVADAFDAMNSDRAYRKSLPFESCIKELQDNSGTHFDPEVVKAATYAFKSRSQNIV
jgi:putative nucleotidyltransferase with HDIG domain